MVKRQLEARGITNPHVLSAFRKAAREAFVPKEFKAEAYEDHPLAIGYGQTISQPYIVAFMSQCLDLSKADRVLEVGTGSGYQTAILAELAGEIYSIEIVERLHVIAKLRLTELGYSNIHLKHADASDGWPEEAPFDKIIVTAAASHIPPALTAQLKEGGKIVIPIGDEESQDLVLGRKEKGTLVTKPLLGVRFVPMRGKEESGNPIK
ncbi:MAG: protein-L-isoaspartate(D-aspartate) O-methyltransferase [Candidatus Omnitrophica bacterium]|nr:protein-L-isoaspartate(D-aspartate) O-methyltransferase [Candidatus Omnitrophota bacterium]